MKPDYISAIVTSALSAVMAEQMDMVYYERRMRRHFSEKFHTPLPTVLEMPFDDVLTHLFESRFEQLKNSSHEEDEEMLWREVNMAVNPNYDHDVEKQNQEFVERIADRERQKHNDAANLDAATAQIRAMNKKLNSKYQAPSIDTKAAKSLKQQSFQEEPSSKLPKGNDRRFEDDTPEELK